MPSRDPTTVREIRPLTGIRGLAAAWVVAFHSREFGLPGAVPAAGWRPFEAMTGCGYLGVDLFFVLSGFVLMWNYGERFARLDARRYADYLRARIARVCPLHVAVLGVLAAAVAAQAWLGTSGPWASGQFPWTDLPFHLAMVHSWGFGSWLSWNHPSWSISAEWFAYLWFPLCCGALLRVRSAWLAAGASALLLAGVARFAPEFSRGAGLNAPHVCGLIRVTGAFLTGCLVCRIHAIAPAASRARQWIAAASGAGILAVAAAGRADPWALPLFALLVFGLTGERGPVARLLSSRPANLAGRISYAVYMVHAPLFMFFHGQVGITPGDGFESARWAVAYLVSPWLVGWAASRWIEEPARRAIRAGA